jgi:cytochrome c oxidase subunit 2
MFGTMIAWHIVGKQNLANEAYRISPTTYMARTEAFAKKYKVREEATAACRSSVRPSG